jgi:polar amino acid transport system substrate-binding protein
MYNISKIYGIDIKYQYQDFDDIIPLIQDTTNLISADAVTDTLARENLVNFALYFKTGTDFLLRSTDTTPINSLDDLCGKTVVVQTGTIQETDVTTKNGQCGGNIVIQSVTTLTDLANAVQDGTAEVGLYDESLLVTIVSSSNGQLKIANKPYDVQPYGIVCNKRNNQLCCAMVDAINYLIQQGTYEQLLKKYSFTYQNNGICPSQINLSGTSCSSICKPSDSLCQTKLSQQ